MKRNCCLMSSLSKLAVACTVLMAVAPLSDVRASESPLEMLRKSIAARTSISFTGVRAVVVFEDGNRVRGVTQRVYSQAPDRMRIEFLSPDNERGKLSVINGNVRWDYDPATGRAVRAETQSPTETVSRRLQELSRIAERTSVQYAGHDTVAGRPTHVIKVFTVEGITLRKSWLDTRTFLNLKTQRFDAQERVRSSAYFTEISYSPTFASGLFDFRPPRGCTIVETSGPSEPVSLAEAERQAGFSAVIPGYLPPGFSLRRDSICVIEVEGHRTLWLPFSDGVETFSLFQRRAGGSSSDIRRRGPSVSWTAGDFVFTLMGPLPRAEMSKIKASVRP